MKKEPLSIEDLKKIYHLRNEGKTTIEIGEAIGRNNSTICCASQNLKKYWNNPKKANRKINIRYQKAILELQGNQNKDLEKTAINEEIKNYPTIDPYQVLEGSFISFQQSISSFIDQMIEKKVSDVKKENEDLKKKIEDFKPVIEEAKRLNWIEKLKEKFEPWDISKNR